MPNLNPKLIDLCTLLSDLAFHDGDSLGQALGVSRAAVWKMVQKLQSYGIDINSRKGKGYALTSPLYLLDIHKISPHFPQHIIKIFETIPSTNPYLLNQGIEDICLAEHQSAGKGRFNRTWDSPFGKNIFLSFSHQYPNDMSTLGGLSLAIAVELCECLESYLALPSPLGIKWPNDIFYQGKKIAGILIEAKVEAHGSCKLVIGIGINVNQYEESIDRTSLSEILDQSINRNVLVVEIIKSMDHTLSQFNESGFTPFTHKWNTRDILKGKELTLSNFEKKVTGVGQGIDTQGQLILETSKKEKCVFSAGDTTLNQK